MALRDKELSKIVMMRSMNLKKLYFFLISLAAFSALTGTASLAQEVPVMENRRELFVDDFIIDKLDGASFRLGQPVSAGPVMTFTAPPGGVRPARTAAPPFSTSTRSVVTLSS